MNPFIKEPTIDAVNVPKVSEPTDITMDILYSRVAYVERYEPVKIEVKISVPIKGANIYDLNPQLDTLFKGMSAKCDELLLNRISTIKGKK